MGFLLARNGKKMVFRGSWFMARCTCPEKRNWFDEVWKEGGNCEVVPEAAEANQKLKIKMQK